MDKQQLVIIGGGMSGIKFAQLLAERCNQYKITILSEESTLAYNRIMLSPVLAGEKKFSDIVLQQQQWYSDHDITVHYDARAELIDSKNKTVFVSDNPSGIQQISYDSLLIATGSLANHLSIPGNDAKGVLSFRDKNDVDFMLEQVKQKPNCPCIVIGAGLLGLEAASALAKYSNHVHVIHRGDHVLDRQLNKKPATILQQYFEAQNIQFHMNANTAAIHANENNQVAGLELACGKHLDASLVVMSVGVRPNKQLAEKSGLECQRGIIVDELMQTSVDNIYSIGECVEFNSELFGLVAPVYEQAEVLASHLCNEPIKGFDIKPTATKLKVSGVDLFSAGEIKHQADFEYLEYQDEQQSIYKRLSIKDDKLVGVVLYGDVMDGAWYFDLLTDQENISDMRNHLIFGQAFHDSMSASA